PAAFGHDISRISARRPQAKMTVSQPGDVHEEEADQVADHVMRMEATDVAMREELPEEEELSRSPLSESSPLVQREGAEDEEEELHRSSMDSASPPLVRRMGENADGSADVSGAVDRGLAGGGAPLDAETRGFMEPRFGRDFSNVRIHTDVQAARSAEEVSARAYTVGSDIAFRSGEYSPGGSDGKRLLAHELTHVVQQGAAGGPALSRSVETRTASRSTVQRDPAEASPAAAPAEKKSPAPRASVGGTVQTIILQYQAMFEKQMEGVKQLESDFATVDEVSTTDMLLQAGVQAALGSAVGALAERIALEAGNAAGDIILSRALAGATAVGELTAADVAQSDSASARATATNLASIGGGWLAGKAQESVPKVYDQIASSTTNPQKFLEAHRLSLIDMKLEAQKNVIMNVAPALEAMPPMEGAVAAERLLVGLEQTYQSAVQVQYLKSVGQWGQVMSGGANTDLTTARTGVLRIVYSATDPMAELSISSAQITDIDTETLARLNDTPALRNMKIRDFPIAKVLIGSGGYDSPPYIVQPADGVPKALSSMSWIMRRAEKYGLDTDIVMADSVQLIVLTAMMFELGDRPIGSLGTISG
ncbi:MAG: DUF4157 domain-containing protein, partial [Capsulimonas sp.]|uniref:eCIS core domain-containing protein n=1 Tax=Capsulimonas sp. TaxID=2494211 RepID=UPI0032665887